VALSVSMAVASAQDCSVSGNSVTCTGGQGASVVIPSSNSFTEPHTVTGTPYPAALVVSGAPAGATVSYVTLTLNGYNAAGPTSGGDNSADVGVLLTDPSGNNLQIMRCAGRGGGGSSQTSLNLTFQDGATAIPPCTGSTNWKVTGAQTYAPSAYDDTARDDEASPSYGISPITSAATLGSGTLGHSGSAGVFTGDAVNGTWSLYLADDGVEFGANISFSSWAITITYTAASTPTGTTLTPIPTTAYTSAPDNSVTLTANVSATGNTPGGTVNFTDGGVTIAGCGAVALSGGSAMCSTAFTTEGIHSLGAAYSGGGPDIASSGSANIFVENHATNPSGTTYCNTGAITNNGDSEGAYSNTNPYPSVISVLGISATVSTVSVQLNGLSSGLSGDMHMLLVSPDGMHALDFWSTITNVGSGSYTLIDGSALMASNGPSASTYGPTAYSLDNMPPDDVFTPGPPTPAPQLPATFSVAAPAGSATFANSFLGATSDGAWSLYLWNGSGPNTTSLSGGWCLNITPASGTNTTTAVTANPTRAALGQSVTFTAIVTGGVGSAGTVTFTENGAPLTGAPNSGVASVANGAATISTSALPEGDHTITATYFDSAETYNESFGTTTMRVDKATSTPTLSANTWSYCNTGAVTIPAGKVAINDIGPAQPNPSNIFVTNLPGTIESLTITLEGLQLADQGASDLETLLVGPNGANPPTTRQTFDFFSLAGNNSPFGPQNTTFEDGQVTLPCSSTSSAPPITDGPTSCGATSYTANAFYTLPSPIQHAGPFGSLSFSLATNGVYVNTNPNGTWSLYFNQTAHETGSALSGGWCTNFTENPVTVSVTKSQTGNFSQGQQGAQFNVAITNTGTAGSTGDPDGNHPLVLTDTLASDFTPGTLPTGTPWNCSASGQTVTCTSDTEVAPGDSYPTLTIPVNVSTTAQASDTNVVAVSGGGVASTNSNTDTVNITPAPVLSISKAPSGTFMQGSTATWKIQVSNSAPAASSTNGSTVTMIDTLPTSYTMSSFTGSGWSCSGTSTVTCTSNAAVAGGTGFPIISLNVNVPANSATSVTNNAAAYGGGDLTHTNSSNAVTTTSTVSVAQVPATITINAGATQSTTITNAFSIPLAVTLKDAGGATISSYPVVFTASTGSNAQSGTFSNSTGTITISTNGSGVASAGTFTANSKVGSYTVGVTAGSAPSVAFNLTNTVGMPANIAATSGSAQSANTNTAFTNPLVVTVTDSGTNPVPGALVTFTPPAQTGASITFAGGINTATTNSLGLATSAAITANGNAGGPYNVAASVGSLSTNFSLTNQASTVNITLATSPAGLLVSANGGSTYQASPYVFSATVGSQVTISTQTPQGANGTQYTWASWSDGGALSHSITVPSTAPTYTATFSTAYQLTVNVSPSGSGTATPASGSYYASGSKVNLTATPNAGYAFTSWTGPVAAASSASTTVTMSAPESVTANFTIAYTNVSSSVSVQSTGLVYNRVEKQGTETFTITNTSAQTISGPVQLILSGLPSGVTAANSTGTFESNPYWTVTSGSLAPGASAQVTVTLAYPSGTNVTASTSVYSGSLP
jgi:hypothetical protein